MNNNSKKHVLAICHQFWVMQNPNTYALTLIRFTINLFWGADKIVKKSLASYPFKFAVWPYNKALEFQADEGKMSHKKLRKKKKKRKARKKKWYIYPFEG